MDGTTENILTAARAIYLTVPQVSAPLSLTSSDEELFCFFDHFEEAKKDYRTNASPAWHSSGRPLFFFETGWCPASPNTWLHHKKNTI